MYTPAMRTAQMGIVVGVLLLGAERCYRGRGYLA